MNLALSTVAMAFPTSMDSCQKIIPTNGKTRKQSNAHGLMKRGDIFYFLFILNISKGGVFLAMENCGGFSTSECQQYGNWKLFYTTLQGKLFVANQA